MFDQPSCINQFTRYHFSICCVSTCHFSICCVSKCPFSICCVSRFASDNFKLKWIKLQKLKIKMQRRLSAKSNHNHEERWHKIKRHEGWSLVNTRKWKLPPGAKESEERPRPNKRGSTSNSRGEVCRRAKVNPPGWPNRGLRSDTRRLIWVVTLIRADIHKIQSWKTSSHQTQMEKTIYRCYLLFALWRGRERGGLWLKNSAEKAWIGKKPCFGKEKPWFGDLSLAPANKKWRGPGKSNFSKVANRKKTRQPKPKLGWVCCVCWFALLKIVTCCRSCWYHYSLLQVRTLFHCL